MRKQIKTKRKLNKHRIIMIVIILLIISLLAGLLAYCSDDIYVFLFPGKDKDKDKINIYHKYPLVIEYDDLRTLGDSTSGPLGDINYDIRYKCYKLSFNPNDYGEYHNYLTVHVSAPSVGIDCETVNDRAGDLMVLVFNNMMFEGGYNGATMQNYILNEPAWGMSYVLVFWYPCNASMNHYEGIPLPDDIVITIYR